ncbi:MAG: hypothetical protein IJS92_06010 [Paludibacteraceae bacterium]|nr:hypothetical protein [Paludibacteraceae bacterium]
MVVGEPRQGHDALHIRCMRAADERAHGRYLVATAAKHPTIIITRACVVIGIDQSPMPEQRICLGKSEAVVIQPAFVHTQAVRNSKRMT